MNELESYYQQNAGSIESMGFEARQQTQEKAGALNVFESKAAAEEEEMTDKEKLEEEGGGAGVAGGMLTKEGIQQVGKQVLGKAKSFAQSKIQSVVDDIKAKVGKPDTPDATPDTSTPPASTSTPPAQAPASQAPASQADIESGLKTRFDALPDDVKKVVGQRIQDDPNTSGSTATTTPDEAKLANDTIDKHITDGENYGTADPPVAPNIPSPVSGSASTSATSSTIADASDTSIARQLGVSSIKPVLPSPTAPDVTATPISTPTVNPSGVIDDTTQNLANKATAITQKGMDTLSDKIGVDFGNLTPSDVGTGLADTLGEGTKIAGAVSKVSEGLEAFGGVADFLGPIGMIAGLGATIAGIVKGVEERKEVKNKQAQIGTLSTAINSTAGMSFGSIASTNLDTSQFRSGGLAANF